MRSRTSDERLTEWAKWALAEQRKPWRPWFAWYPVEDWDTGQWMWLETVYYKYRWDGAGARYYYKPKPTLAS